MNKNEWHDARAILAHRGLGGGHTFDYYRDRYAMSLLQWAVDAPHVRAGKADVNVRALKRSPFAPLLEKPRVAKVIQRCGTKAISADWLAEQDHGEDARRYWLSIGTWGAPDEREAQTSRAGVNLVLQLNFDQMHDAVYERLVKPHRKEAPFEYGGHPVAMNRNTLAWARIDLDLRRGEALIEEIQSDWLREVENVAERAERAMYPCPRSNRKYPFTPWYMKGNAKQMWHYYDNYVRPHARDWPEAMLLAALWLIREQFRIRQIFYHSWESGVVLKQMSNRWSAPKSLYSDLPKRFCFQKVKHTPQFLQRDVKQSDFSMYELWL